MAKGQTVSGSQSQDGSAEDGSLQCPSVDSGPAGRLAQRDAEAVSSLAVLKFRVCMHEEMLFKKTLHRRGVRLEPARKMNGRKLELIVLDYSMQRV